MTKIVVLDGHTANPGDLSWEPLERLGELTVHDRTKPGEIVARAADADVVLTNKTVLTAEAIATLPRLKLICVLATGYNVVDVAAAKARGIPVCNVPEYSTPNVAQAVFAMLLGPRGGRWSTRPIWRRRSTPGGSPGQASTSFRSCRRRRRIPCSRRRAA